MGVVEGVADVLASSAWFGICGGGLGMERFLGGGEMIFDL